MWLFSPAAWSEAEAPAAENGRALAEKVNARDDGTTLENLTSMELIDRSGTTITREIRVFRKYFGGDRKTAIFFTGPKNVRSTAFLTFDYQDPAQEDDQWLYLPAQRKVRRVSASNRGDYFLGTDFTYEDIKNGTKLSLDSFRWELTGESEIDGAACLVLRGVAIDDATARELGYGRVQIDVDRELSIPRKFVAWDTGGNLLKTVMIRDIRLVGVIWQPHRLEAENHKTTHKTIFSVRDVQLNHEVSDDLFTEGRMSRGI